MRQRQTFGLYHVSFRLYCHLFTECPMFHKILPALSESLLPPYILLKLQGRGILVVAKALATPIFAVIRWSACRISGECDLFHSDRKHVLLLIVLQLPDGIGLVYHHVSVLPTRGHTDPFNVWNHFNRFQQTLAYWTIEWEVGSGSFKFHLQKKI